MFKKELFSELKYSEKLIELQGYAEWINQFREALKSEGFPTDRATESRADDFDAFLDDQMNAYLKRLGIIPNAEKERISGVYEAIGKRLHTFSSRAGSALRSGVELNDDGSVNEEKLEEAARLYATTKYDVERLASYFDKIKKVEKAVKELKNYQQANGLPDLTRNRVLGNQTYPGEVFTFIDRGGNEEAFQEIAGKYFITTN